MNPYIPLFAMAITDALLAMKVFGLYYCYKWIGVM